MTDEQHLEDGLAILKKMLGSEEAERMRQRWRQLSPELEHLILSFVAGQIWTRHTLDLKTRSLCTIAALTALGRTSAIELNIRMALGNGATKEEVLEAMIQMAPYAGFPAAWEGLRIASSVFGPEETVE